MNLGFQKKEEAPIVGLIFCPGRRSRWVIALKGESGSQIYTENGSIKFFRSIGEAVNFVKSFINPFAKIVF